MTCPNCGAPVADPEAAFCSRCGGPLSGPETEATEKIDVPPETSSMSSTGPLLADYASALRRKAVTSWLDPLGAASLGFLVLLVLGAVLLIAAKLQFSGFGAGASPIDILAAITIIGLAVLRVPVHLDDLVVSALPLGALAAAALGISWATSVTFRNRGDLTLWSGAAVGIPFALICWIAALVFRFDGEGGTVFAGAWGALFWGLLWGSLFGALGAMRARTPGRRFSEVIAVASEASAVRRGVTAAVIALAAATVLASVAILLWVIVGLFRGAPGPRFGFPDAVAAVVYLVAFAPNIIVSLTALGMGAPVYVGARVTVAGARVGEVERVWLFGDAPGYLVLLVAIPLVACSIAGFWARRSSKRDEAFMVLGTFAVAFAVALGSLAWLGEARLGAALLGRGLARLDVNALATVLFGFAWAALAGLGGWSLAEMGGDKE